MTSETPTPTLPSDDLAAAMRLSDAVTETRREMAEKKNHEYALGLQIVRGQLADKVAALRSTFTVITNEKRGT